MGRAKLKACYTLSELASMSGISRWRVRRLLERNGVAIAKSGSDRVVFLSALKKALPELWDSILERSAASENA